MGRYLAWPTGDIASLTGQVPLRNRRSFRALQSDLRIGPGGEVVAGAADPGRSGGLTLV